MKFPCQILAVVQRGQERWERPVGECEKNTPIWRLCAETQRQFESDQWLRQKGFRKVQ